jgi:hypothetical protein
MKHTHTEKCRTISIKAVDIDKNLAHSINVLLLYSPQYNTRIMKQRFLQIHQEHIRFEAVTAVVMKTSVFWRINPCNLLRANRRCFHAGFLLGLFYDPIDWNEIFLLNIDWWSPDYMVLCLRRRNTSTVNNLRTSFFIPLKKLWVSWHQLNN